MAAGGARTRLGGVIVTGLTGLTELGGWADWAIRPTRLILAGLTLVLQDSSISLNSLNRGVGAQ